MRCTVGVGVLVVLFIACTFANAEDSTELNKFEDGEVADAATMNENFEILSETINGMNQNFDEIFGTINGMNENFDETFGKINGLNENYDGISETINGMNQNFDEIFGKINGLNENFDEISEKVNGMNENFDEISENINGMNQNFEILSEKINGMTDLKLYIGGTEVGTVITTSHSKGIVFKTSKGFESIYDIKEGKIVGAGVYYSKMNCEGNEDSDQIPYSDSLPGRIFMAANGTVYYTNKEDVTYSDHTYYSVVSDGCDNYGKAQNIFGTECFINDENITGFPNSGYSGAITIE